MKDNKRAIRIHLKPKLHIDNSKNLLDKLINVIGLNTYGDYYLSDNARIDMRAAAILMFVIFTFDLLAWTMLFNLIFNRGNMELSLISILAFMLAIFLSVVTIIFERNIFVADTTEGKSSWFAMGCRVVIVLFSAFVTAQPIHMLIFETPIMERHQEEQIIAYAVSTTTKINEQEYILKKLEKKLGGIKADDPELAKKRVMENLQVQDYADRINKANEKLKKYEENKRVAFGGTAEIGSEIELIKKSISNFRYQKKVWKRKAKNTNMDKYDLKKKLNYYDRKISKAKGKISKLSIQKGAQKNNVDFEEKEIEALKAERDISQAKKDALVVKLLANERKKISELNSLQGQETKLKREEINHEIDAQRRFISKLRGTAVEPGESMVMNVPTKEVKINDQMFTVGKDLSLSFRFDKIGFSKQYRIFHDLEEGKEPRWPTLQMEQVEIDILKKQFKLQRTPDQNDKNSLAAQLWAIDKQKLKDEGKLLKNQSFLAYFVGIFVPLMVLLFKFFIPGELKQYYSSEYQANRGHPEALKYRETIENTKKRREEKEEEHTKSKA
jgi:hypothetical protein